MSLTEPSNDQLAHDDNAIGLATELRRLRLEAGMSGHDLGAACGLSQSKISRIERGRAQPTEIEVRALAGALKLDRVATAALVQAVRRTTRTSGPTYSLDDAVAGMQQHLFEVEKASTRMDKYSCNVVSGMLQTERYARAILQQSTFLASDLSTDIGDADEFVERNVVTRMQRQVELYDTRKTVRILLADTVLRSAYGSNEIMVEQLRFLANLPFRNMSLKILDTSVPTIFGKAYEFEVFDDELVYIESQFANWWQSRPSQVNNYKLTFDHLWNSEAARTDVGRELDAAIKFFEARPSSDGPVDIRASRSVTPVALN